MEIAKGAPAERIFTPNFVRLCFANFGGFGNYHLLIAGLPLFIGSIGGTQSDIGLVVGAYSVTACLVRPFVGAMADRRGKKGLMLGGIIVMTVAALFYGFAQSIPLLFGVRILHGVGWGTFHTALSALAADVIPARRRGEAMGYFGIFGNVAMGVGPAAGIMVADSLGFFSLFVISALSTIVALVSTIGAKEAVSHQKASAAPLASRLINRRALLPSAVYFACAISLASINAFLPLVALQRQLGNPGLFFAAYVIVLIVSRGPLGRLSDKYGRVAVTAPGLFLGAMSMTVLASATSMLALLLAAVFFGLCFAAAQPTIVALAVDRVAPAERGSAMGTLTTAQDLGVGLGAIMWGMVAQLAGYDTMYYLSGFVMLSGLAILLGGTFRQSK